MSTHSPDHEPRRHEHPQHAATDRGAFRCCGTRIDALALDHAAELVAGGRAIGAVHLCNAYTLSLARRDPVLAATLADSTLNLPDGMPLVWIARRLGLRHMTDRVYGPDLMKRTLDVGSRLGTRHVLFGSTPQVLAQLERSIASQWPDAVVVDALAPPFSDSMADFDVVLQTVTAHRADVVWVGLGTPKQDFVVARLSERAAALGIEASFVAIGAAFDFIAGTKRQAPSWMQRRGLEWLHRLIVEPRRLWKRYLVGNSRFVWGVARDRPILLPGGGISNQTTTADDA